MLLKGDAVQVVEPAGFIRNIEDVHYLATYKGKQGTVTAILEHDVYAVQFAGYDRLGYFYGHELQKVRGK